MLQTDRPSSAEYDILSAEEETPAQLGARLNLMPGDLGDHQVMIGLLPPGRAHAAVARRQRRFQLQNLNFHFWNLEQNNPNQHPRDRDPPQL